jgi:hypothetical protein
VDLGDRGQFGRLATASDACERIDQGLEEGLLLSQLSLDCIGRMVHTFS